MTRIKIGVNSSGYPEPMEKAGFPFSPAFAEAASRSQAGMTKRNDYDIYGQTLNNG